MGLDVYLRKCADLAHAKEVEQEYEERERKIWAAYGAYDDMTDDQKTEAHQAADVLANELGIVDGYRHQSIERIEDQPSAVYPDHLFKIGYFRSSYNAGGLNSLAMRLELSGLYDLFPQGDQEYEFKPDWYGALEAVEGALEQWRAHDLWDVMELQHYTPPTIHTAAEALELFKKEHATKVGGFDSYSHRTGDFFLSGIKIYAVIPRVEGGVFVVFENDLSWYVQALEIVKETIEFVLAQPDWEDYYLVWSS